MLYSITVILFDKIYYGTYVTSFSMHLLSGDTLIEYFMVATVRLLL